MTADESEPIDASTTTPENSSTTETVPAQEDNLDLAARVELLEEENRRLRTEYARARQSKYRRTAYGLFAVGALTLTLGVLFSEGQEVLFALGATGLFGGVLTLYLTPSRFVAADVTERVYTAVAANYAALVESLGLTETAVYLPGESRAAHLYVPQSPEYDIPSLEDGPFVTAPDSRGFLLEATGALLFEEFERASSGPVATQPGELATQLAEAVVEQFELADAINAERDPTGGRLTFRVTGSTLGDLDRLDHPLTSFLAAGCTVALDRPVTLDVDTTDERADWLVTLRWDDETEQENTGR
ncbi:hypothetical protein ACFQJ7_10065 [Halovenus rubra]|uniref:DUF7982 domain-containing protein n=2 Tax=Halovenus rubra TaxID=869890 RepID=A0ABD5X5C0_9EURY|nr:hypothetical protein [Halovenus rubra]